MTENFVMDSAGYIDLMRAGVDVRQPLVPFLRAARLYNSGVVRAEVLRGVKELRARAGIEEFFDIIPEIPCDAKLWRQVSHLGWNLARGGKWPPVTDLIIAASCLRVRATLISPDVHFRDIPGLTVVPAIPE
jgi:predicted nucleic acid-binding protein